MPKNFGVIDVKPLNLSVVDTKPLNQAVTNIRPSMSDTGSGLQGEVTSFTVLRVLGAGQYIGLPYLLTYPSELEVIQS